MSQFNKLNTTPNPLEGDNSDFGEDEGRASLDLHDSSESLPSWMDKTVQEFLLRDERLDRETPNLIDNAFERGLVDAGHAVRFGVGVVAREGDDPFTTAKLAKKLEVDQTRSEEYEVTKGAFTEQYMVSSEEQQAEIDREFNKHFEKEERILSLRGEIEQGVERLDYGDLVGSAIENLYKNKDSIEARESIEKIGFILSREELVDALIRDTNEEGLKNNFKDYILMSSEVSSAEGLDSVSDDSKTSYAREKVEGLNEYISKIMPLHDNAIESGFKEDKVSSSTLGVFSKYASNLIQYSHDKEPENLYEASYRVGSENLKRFARIGQGGSKLYENFPRLANRLIMANAGEYSSEELLEINSKLERIQESDSDLKDYVFDIVQLADSGRINDVKDFDSASDYLEFAESILAKRELVNILSKGREENEEDAVRLLFKSRDFDKALYGQDRDLAIEKWLEIVDSLGLEEDSKYSITSNLLKDNRPEWSVDIINSPAIKTRLEGEGADIIRDNLLQFSIMRSDSLESCHEMVNYSLDLIDRVEDLDVRDKSIDDVLRVIQKLEWSSNLVLSKQESRQVFSGLFTKFGTKVDKDGNLYDPANLIGKVIQDSYRHHHGRILEGPKSPEAVEWFSSKSNLPISAYDVVTSMRHEASVAGIEDTPEAIYEWTFANPERVSELSRRNLIEYVSESIKLSNSYEHIEIPEGMDGLIEGFKSGPEKNAEVIIEFARQVAEARQENFRNFVNISEDSLKLAVAGGMQLKSILDVEVSSDRGDSYDQRRSGVEVALGIRSIDESTAHPIYGSAGFVDDGIPRGAYGYGEILMTFKQDMYLQARTSYTPEDSFHGANRLTREDAMTLRVIKDMFGIGHSQTSSYIETQVAGGLDINEVESIFVLTQSQKDSISEVLPDELKERVVLMEDRYRNDFKFNRSIIEAAARGGDSKAYLPGAQSPIDELNFKLRGDEANSAIDANYSGPLGLFDNGLNKSSDTHGLEGSDFKGGTSEGPQLPNFNDLY